MRSEHLRCLVSIIALSALCEWMSVPPAIGAITQRWVAPIDRFQTQSVQLTAIAGDNTGDTVVAIGKYPGKLFFIDHSGNRLWNYDVKGGFVAGADISPSGESIVLQDVVPVQPQSEERKERLVMLNRRGSQVWQRRAAGIPRFSPDGAYILTYTTGSVSLHKSSDGELLWRNDGQQLSMLDEATFAADSKHILVNGPPKISMLSIAGKVIWSKSFDGITVSAATSADGSVTAILAGGQTSSHEVIRRLVLLDRTGSESAAVELTRSKPFEPPSPEQGDWYEVRISADGKLIALLGASPGVTRLRVVDHSGNLLWSKDIQSSGSATIHLLPSRSLILALHQDNGTVLQLLSPRGALLASQIIPGGSEFALSPNGVYASAFAGWNAYSFVLSSTIAPAEKAKAD